MAERNRLGLEARWKTILEDFVAGDLGVSQYCQERKISKASLYKWSQLLEIPLKNRSALTQSDRVDNNDDPTNSAKEEGSFSFIELKLPPSAADASFPLKLELLLAQDRKLRMEVPSTWDQLVGMIKKLVS